MKPSGKDLLFQSHQLVDAALMPGFAGEFGAQPDVGNLQSQIFAHNTGTHSHHVGVVVQTGHLGGPGIAEQSAADATSDCVNMLLKWEIEFI